MFQIDFDLEDTQEKEYKFPEDAKEGEPQAILTIRPYPESMANMIIRKIDNQDGVEMVLSKAEQKKAFIYAWIGAKDLVDKNGKEIKFTEKNKSLIFDFEHIWKTGIPAFVLSKSGALYLAKEEEEKN